MVVCFLCDTKLYNERTLVCSSITPHSNVPYAEKIAELMGDEVVVIVTPTDKMCNKCTSLLAQMDKLENDLKLVKNALLSYIQMKYEILPPYHAVKNVKVRIKPNKKQVVNGNLKTEEPLVQNQRKVPSGLTEGVSPTVNTAALVIPIQTPLKLLKTQQKQQQEQQQQPRPQQKQQPPIQQENANKIKVYVCGFCTFQSSDLGNVQFHRRTHVEKKNSEKPILNLVTAKALTPVPQQKKQIFRCQVCSKSFVSRLNCLDHIQKDHRRSTLSTLNGVRETKDSLPVTTKVMEPEPSNTQENNQQAESPMDVDENQQVEKKGTNDTDIILNDDVPTEGSAVVEKGEDPENSQEGKTVKEAKSKIQPNLAQEKTAEEEKEDEENTAVLKKGEADQETPDSVKKEFDEDNANVEIKTRDLEI